MINPADPTLQTAVLYAAAGYARDLVRRLIQEEPEITGKQVLAAVEADFQIRQRAADQAATGSEDGTCKRCGHPVVRQADGSFVTHADSNGYPLKRGCRAASFDRDGDWDDNLDKRWQATWS